MSDIWGSPSPDSSDAFVHRAVSAFARGLESPAPPSGETWMSRAVDAGVLPVVLDGLVRAGYTPAIDLARTRIDAVLRQQRTMWDLKLAGAALDAAGIEWAVVKGPVLRSMVYERGNVRDYSDLDLLVSPKAIRRAVQLLLGAGAELMDIDIDMGLRDRTAELNLRLKNGTVLDLHWSLGGKGTLRDRFSASTDDLLSHRVQRTLDGVDLYTLQDTDLVLHVLLHGCLNGATQLRWLLDAHQCIRWFGGAAADLDDRARELGWDLVAKLVLQRASCYVDPALAPWAESIGGTNLWTLAAAAADRRWPPSMPSAGRSSGKALFASTGASTGTGVVRLLRRRRWSRASRRRGWPGAEPHSIGVGDPRLGRWFDLAEHAEQESRRPAAPYISTHE